MMKCYLLEAVRREWVFFFSLYVSLALLEPLGVAGSVVSSGKRDMWHVILRVLQM